MPRIRPTISVAVALALTVAGAGAALASRAGISLPLGGAAASSRQAETETQSSGDEPAPAPPASKVETESSGESPPVIDVVVDGDEGLGGWYIGDVTLTWTVSDDETPDVTSDGCEPATVTDDTTGTAFVCTATSDGGTTTTTATVAKDATAPDSVSVVAVPAANAGGWHSAPFTATWDGTDATSGIAHCTVTEYSGPDAAGGVLDGTCTDRAGNESAPVAYAFSYDATAPVVRAVPDREPDANGWYNHALTVAWTSDDPDAECDPAATHEPADSDDITITGSCRDQAGNQGTGTFAFRYDATPPLVTIVSPSEPAYVLRQPVTVRYRCEDATSGIDRCEGTPGDGDALDTASVGPHAVSAVAVDQAGNRASDRHDYDVVYSPAGVRCGGVAGHQILEPIRADGTSTVNGNSTVPAKFRVCDYFGSPVTTGGIVASFRIVAIDGASADAPVPSTSSHEQFRSGQSQWIFNVNAKGLRGGSIYDFRIALDDGTAIPFRFAITKPGNAKK